MISNLILIIQIFSRNTFPYKVNDNDADYDFVNESYETFAQIAEIEATSQGEIDDLIVVNGGQDYRIGDVVNFDESDTEMMD